MSLTWSESVRLATKGGPPDRLRRWLIAGCAALGTMVLAAAASVPTFWSEGGSVPGQSVLGMVLADQYQGRAAIVGLALFAVPIVHFMAQAVRVGAPARDRRLAAMRSAGATRGDVRSVLRAETLVWALPGSLVGVALYYAVMSLAPRWTVPVMAYADADARVVATPILALPGWPHPLVIVAIALLVPIIAAVLVPMAARRVAVGEAAQGVSERMPSALLALALTAATVGAATVLAIAFLVDPYAGGQAHSYTQPLLRAQEVLILVAPVLLVLTVVAVAPFVTARLGSLLANRSGASAFLAGAMMQARPRLAARTAVSLVFVALIGGVAVTLAGVIEAVVVRSAEAMQMGSDAADPSQSSDVLFYTVPFVIVQVLAVLAGVLAAIGLLITVAEQVALRGAGLARQVALGVPRLVLRRALVIEVAAPVALMVSVVLATAALFALV